MTDPLPDDEPLVPIRLALPRRLARVHRATLGRWIAAGLRTGGGAVIRLPAWRIGTRWMTTPRLAAEFLQAVTTTADTSDLAGNRAAAIEAADRHPAISG